MAEDCLEDSKESSKEQAGFPKMSIVIIIIIIIFAVAKILGSLHHILKSDPCPEQHYFNFWPDSLLRTKLSEEIFLGLTLFMEGILQFGM